MEWFDFAKVQTLGTEQKSILRFGVSPRWSCCVMLSNWDVHCRVCAVLINSGNAVVRGMVRMRWYHCRTEMPEGGECDGFHLSLRADLDDTTRIEADRQETTWASIYVRLRGGGLPGPETVVVPAGSTIVANCAHSPC